MKKILLTALMVFTIVSYSQKKKNGTVYREHPAINTVESMEAAFVAGDADKVASYLADDFKGWNGVGTNKDAKGRTKENLVNGIKWWKDNISYLSMERSKGAYPDAIEYKDGDNDDVVWVQTWSHIKGVHNKSGVKLDMPIHRLYVVNKENKIKTIINYTNESVWDEIGDSYSERENGTLYNQHPYINKVRRMIHAYENKDFETAYSFYDEKAKFSNINMPVGETYGLEENKENDKKFTENFDITSIDVRGYPDYLNYGIGDAKVVQSWWNVRLTRKSDDKKMVVPVMFIHYFNDDGKIVNETGYFSDNFLKE